MKKTHIEDIIILQFFFLLINKGLQHEQCSALRQNRGKRALFTQRENIAHEFQFFCNIPVHSGKKINLSIA